MSKRPTHRTARMIEGILWISLTLFAAAAHVSQGAPKRSIDVGMITLLASPDKFNGKTISTIGFLNIGRLSEDDCLLLYEEDGRANRYHNMLALGLSDDQRRQFAEFNQSYVMVTGTFHSNKRKNARLNGGSIAQITKMIGWQPYRHPSAAK